MDQNIRLITEEELALLRQEQPELFETDHPANDDYWAHLNDLLFDAPGG